MIGNVAVSLMIMAASQSLERSIGDRHCDAGAQEVERRILVYRLTEAHFRVFKEVAQRRQAAGLEVLPGMMGCPSVAKAAKEVQSDRGSRSLLRKGGLSAKQFIVTGWALIVGSDPLLFNINGKQVRFDVFQENQSFLSRHKHEINELLYKR
jgi:hypothetical protein